MSTLFNRRNFFCGILFLLSFAFFSQVKSSDVQTINGVKYYIHKIEKGQSLYSLTKLYGVTLDEIYNANPEVKAGTKAGQEIKIPFRNTAVNTSSAVISQSTAITVTAVANKTTAVTNTIVNTNTVVNTSTGTVLSGTNTPIDTSAYIVYKVGRKETLYSIGKKYNISEAELKILNPFLINSGPKEGQILIVGEKKRVVKTNVPVRPVSTHPDSINPNVVVHPKKNAYNLALILPFKLDQSLNTDINALAKNKSNFPSVPALAVDFYLGFKKAADSLSGQGIEFNIDLYDGDDNDSATLVRITNEQRFKQTDFIFGPLYAGVFKTIALKAREYGIPIVSPITQQNKMLYNNVYVSKTNPSQFTLIECLADYCLDSMKTAGANIILVQLSNDPREISYLKAFKKYYNDRIADLGRPQIDTVPQVKGLIGVKSVFKAGAKNIIVMLSDNQVQITDFTTQLAIFSEKKDITLCGWQKLTVNENLDQEYLNLLHYTFPYQYNLTNTSSYAPIIPYYRSQQNAYPGEYYFIGFDIAYYYLKNLKESGPDFIYSLNRIAAEGNYMRFKFTRPDNLTGYDNRGAYIFRYNNYQLERTGWK